MLSTACFFALLRLGTGFPSVVGSRNERVAPLRLCSFESRRAQEMRSLIERSGAIATVVPSLQEIPRTLTPDIRGLLRKLEQGRVDVLILMTGVGLEFLRTVAATVLDDSELRSQFSETCLIVRGPKPAKVLREWGVRFEFQVPAPNTSRQLLELLDDGLDLTNKEVAILEYGEPDRQLAQAISQRGATVDGISVYRWGLPDDCGPLRTAIRSTIAGEFDALLFTSATQLRHVMQVAEQLDLLDAWLDAAGRMPIGSIGPTCSAAIRDAGLEPTVEASPPRMGQLVRTVISTIGC